MTEREKLIELLTEAEDHTKEEALKALKERSEGNENHA